jgi:colanic acid/amylovoran biosynthesis protein
LKILVVNAYVREEAGDAALLSVLLDQVTEAFPGSEVCVAGMESSQDFADFEGKRNLGSVRRWTADEEVSRPNRIVRKIVAGLVGFFWFRGPKKVWGLLEQCLPSEPRSELSALRTADLVVGVGGGYMQGKGIGGDINIFYLLLPLALAKRLKKPLVLAPQSYGPFSNKRQKKAVMHVLHDIDAVFVREEPSMTLLKSLGAKPRRLERAVDSGFAFEGGLTRDWRKDLSIDGRIPLVGMTARQWLEPIAQGQYEEALSLTVDHIQTACGSRVVLIPQVMASYRQDDDRIVQGRIAAGSLPECKPINLIDLNDYRELKSLYGSLDYFIGTRLHSVIFALISFVPCIAIEYEHKTGGIMRELGLHRWVVPIEDVTAERLRSLFDELLHEADSYRAHLREVIPPYVNRSRAFVAALKQIGAGESLTVESCELGDRLTIL